MDKKKYQSPTVIALGTVTELTQELLGKCGSAADALTGTIVQGVTIGAGDVNTMPMGDDGCGGGGGAD